MTLNQSHGLFGHLPNALSLVRVGVLPFIIYLLEGGEQKGHLLAAVLFCVAGASDVIDGWVARHLGRPTLVGLYIDILADKILFLSVSTLLILAPVPPWFSVFVMVFLTKEIFLSALLGVATAQKHEIQPPVYQRWQDGTLFFGLLFILLGFGLPHSFLLTAGLSLTGVSALFQMAIMVYYGRAFAKAVK